MSKPVLNLTIEVVWDHGKLITEYFYATKKEESAFLDGIHEALGYHNCVVCGRNYKYSTAQEYLKEIDDE